jgi:hypothetical protein
MGKFLIERICMRVENGKVFFFKGSRNTIYVYLYLFIYLFIYLFFVISHQVRSLSLRSWLKMVYFCCQALRYSFFFFFFVCANFDFKIFFDRKRPNSMRRKTKKKELFVSRGSKSNDIYRNNNTF